MKDSLAEQLAVVVESVEIPTKKKTFLVAAGIF
jgi:hypothetical protein